MLGKGNGEHTGSLNGTFMDINMIVAIAYLLLKVYIPNMLSLTPLFTWRITYLKKKLTEIQLF